jgi:hypothetical protein
VEGIDRFGLEEYLGNKRQDERNRIMQELMDSRYIKEMLSDKKGIAMMRYRTETYIQTRFEILQVSEDPSIDRDERFRRLEECGLLTRFIKGHLEYLAGILQAGDEHTQKINALA